MSKTLCSTLIMPINFKSSNFHHNNLHKNTRATNSYLWCPSISFVHILFFFFDHAPSSSKPMSLSLTHAISSFFFFLLLLSSLLLWLVTSSFFFLLQDWNYRSIHDAECLAVDTYIRQTKRKSNRIINKSNCIIN